MRQRTGQPPANLTPMASLAATQPIPPRPTIYGELAMIRALLVNCQRHPKRGERISGDQPVDFATSAISIVRIGDRSEHARELDGRNRGVLGGRGSCRAGISALTRLGESLALPFPGLPAHNRAIDRYLVYHYSNTHGR